MSFHYRREASLRDREQERLIRIGLPTATRIGTACRVAALRAYRDGMPIAEAVRDALQPLRSLAVDAMTAGHLQAQVRVARSAQEQLLAKQRGRAYFYRGPGGDGVAGPYDAAIAAMQQRMEFSEQEMIALQARYGERAIEVTRNLSYAVELRAQGAVGEIVRSGAHVREGMNVLGAALSAAGVTSAQPYLLETLVRTQMQVGYSAGQWQANQDPAIQEILWGYVYVTVGDDRVRPGHMALDGTKLRKEDSRWAAIWPPNGYNCRCKTIEIFEPEESVDIPATKIVDGATVVPGPDQGWAFNAGIALAA